jgi:hypothetical protein
MAIEQFDKALNVDSKCLDAMVGKANILIGN